MRNFHYIDSASQPQNFLIDMESTPQLHKYVSSASIQNTNNIMIPIKDPTATTTTFSSTYHTSQLKSPADDPEISIFDAQRYFEETGPESDPKAERLSSPIIPLCTTIPRLSSVSSSSSTPADIRNYSRNYGARSFHTTPTVSSEASWNSQTGLLSNPPCALPVRMRTSPDRNPIVHNEKTKGRASNKWFFGRKCPCSGKKSVQVKQKIQVPPLKTLFAERVVRENHDLVHSVQENELVPIHRHSLSSPLSHNDPFPLNGFHHKQQERLSGSVRRVGDGSCGFSFPILSKHAVPQLSTTPFDDPPRESLEVYQPLEDNSLPRKIGVRGYGLPGSPTPRVTATDDDMASDASSDLFEIESFSTQTTTYFRRGSLEEAQHFHSNRPLTTVNRIYSCRRSMDEQMTPSIAPTEGYEPSEASIDWSVTTAEGFDRQSLTNFSVSASEIDTAVRRQQAWDNGSGGSRDGTSRRKGTGGGLLLLSCRHEKAVNVGPQPVKCIAAGVEGQPASVLPLVSGLRHVTSRGQYCTKPPAVTGSNSARLSLAFAV